MIRIEEEKVIDCDDLCLYNTYICKYCSHEKFINLINDTSYAIR